MTWTKSSRVAGTAVTIAMVILTAGCNTFYDTDQVVFESADVLDTTPDTTSDATPDSTAPDTATPPDTTGDSDVPSCTMCGGSTCVELDTDIANCGGCGLDCAALPHTVAAEATCQDGTCGFTCASGFDDCNEEEGDGCEADLDTEVAHCGGCNMGCDMMLPNVASLACDQGSCAIGECEDGWGDCDGELDNGCELSLVDDLGHCGACQMQCAVNPAAPANTEPACRSGACVDACVAGTADCNDDMSDGCESSVTLTVDNCCGVDCTMSGSPDVETYACVDGACLAETCAADMADCNGDLGDGCEVDLTALDHCGACGNDCAMLDSTNVASFACVEGACQPTCASGFADCDGDPGNGCEVDLRSDDANCGECALNCTTRANIVSGTCQGGACQLVCKDGFADCDNQRSTGCEADTRSDDDRCGGCDIACEANESCTSSLCKCDEGWGDCSSAAPGCETDLLENCSHCNGCGMACAGTEECNGGGCEFALFPSCP